MTTTNKIVKLKACASVHADLAFQVGGIIDTSNVTLGQMVTSFGFDSFYTNLGNTTETQTFFYGGGGVYGVEGGVAQATPQFIYRGPQTYPILANLWNSGDIASNVSGSQLLCLRAEGVKAALDKACALRANIYYGKFANQSDIVTQMQNNYSASKSTSKPAYLASLSKLAGQQYSSLNSAYNSDSRTGVVKQTTSSLTATTNSTTNMNQTTTGTYGGNTTGPNTTTGTDSQNMSYTDYGYRIPSIEANAQNLRAQISLIDEQFAQYMAGQYLANINSVFANEQTSVNMDVKRLQYAYLNTILLSPINGQVTAIYKQPGEAVMAGEPVVRVEDTSTVNLVGVIIYRGMLSVGASVTVNANLFSTSTMTSLPGTVLAARGHESGDDRWEVVISCGNGGSGSPLVPPNYNFDFDDTTITI
jgi:HlyD family secretion protein